MKERIPELMKELRKGVHTIKTKKLMKLDRSDRIFIEQKLENLINEMYRLEAIGNSQCTCVLELYEWMGGQVETCKS